MFRKIKTRDGAGEYAINKLMLTDAESQVDGALYVVTSGRLTIAAGTVKPQYIGRGAITGGTSVYGEVAPIRNDDEFEADYENTAPVVGVKVYQTDATGLLVAGDSTTGGLVEILAVDIVNTKVTCKYND